MHQKGGLWSNGWMGVFDVKNFNTNSWHELLN